MRRGMCVQLELFQAPAPSIDVPEALRGKTVELLRRLLTEALAGEEKELLEDGNEHDHG